MAPSLTQLLIVLAIVILLFGTKKLRNLGGDLGSAIKNFKTSVKDGEDAAKKHLDGEEAETTSAKVAAESEKTK